MTELQTTNTSNNAHGDAKKLTFYKTRSAVPSALTNNRRTPAHSHHRRPRVRYVQRLMLTLLIQPVLAADRNSNAVGDASRPLARISESFFTD